MRKYGASLIYQLHDDDGMIEVVEANGIRSLHFGSYPKQSCIALDAPDVLQLAYCRAMMSWQLFMDSFNDALLIGLGGGSIAKYLLQQFPHGTIEAIESRQTVVSIAYSYFMLPEDPRLIIHIGDGGEFIRENARRGWKRYDLIMIDAFDHDMISASVNYPAFFDACIESLTPRGIMTMNLWGANNPGFELTASYIEQSFNDKVLFLPVNGKDNIIALGLAAAMPKFCIQQLRRKAELMQHYSQIEFPNFIKDMKHFNADSLERVMQ